MLMRMISFWNRRPAEAEKQDMFLGDLDESYQQNYRSPEEVQAEWDERVAQQNEKLCQERYEMMAEYFRAAFRRGETCIEFRTSLHCPSLSYSCGARVYGKETFKCPLARFGDKVTVDSRISSPGNEFLVVCYNKK